MVAEDVSQFKTKVADLNNIQQSNSDSVQK